MSEAATATATATWRDWSPEDQARQPRRTCSIAGCKEVPERVKVTTTLRPDGKVTTRRHAYCAAHAQS